MKTTDFTGLENGSGRNEQDNQGRNADGATLEAQANLLQEPMGAGDPVKVDKSKPPAPAPEPVKV